MKKERTYQTLTFNTIRRRNGHIELTKSMSLSNEKYEEYEKCEPYDFISMYYHHKITGKPVTINDIIIEQELIHSLNIEEKHKDIWIKGDNFATAMKEVNNRKAEIHKIIECKEIISPLKDIFVKNDKGLFTFKKWKDDLRSLKYWLKEHNTKIIIGKPGSGKTHFTINQIDKLGKTTLVVTLSNLVGANFVSRFNKSNIEGTCEFASYTKVRFMDMKHYDTIVFEEASMLSTNELPLIIKCLHYCDNVFFCGDTNQLPSFLGFGNILYGLITEFPDKVIELKKNYRCSNEVVNGMDNILSGKFPKIYDKTEFGSLLNESLINESNMIIPAFSNETVKKMNNYCLQLLSGTNVNCIEHILSIKKKKIPVRATSNIKVKKNNGTYEYKFYNNELCDVYKEGSYYVVQSRLYPNHREQYTTLDFITDEENFNPRDFTLAYSITVHKSQGLEWDEVFFVNDANDWLRNRNLCYVAYTRSRKNTYIYSPSGSSTGKIITYYNIFR